MNNVLAYLPGKTDEYIIIGAHYDHLGRGDSNSLAPSQIGQIHPGADDNASGTAGVLELARLLAPLKGQLDRGILFMSFSGEELGLLGSAEWVKEPTLPLDKCVAMINMDMIGRIRDNKIYIGGMGTGLDVQGDSGAGAEASPTSRSSIPPAATRPAITHRSSPRKFRCCSSFPGLHADYHKPSDTWDKINAPVGGASCWTWSLTWPATGVGASSRRSSSRWWKTSRRSGVSRRRRLRAVLRLDSRLRRGEDGVHFSDVRPGSPAAKAG